MPDLRWGLKADMQITRKIFFTLLGFYLGFGGIAIGVLLLFVLPQFVALEEEQARSAMQGCAQAVDREVDALKTTVRDWRYWDPMSEYCKAPNDQFIEENVGIVSLENANLDMILIYNVENQRLFHQNSESTGPDVWLLAHDKDNIDVLTGRLLAGEGPDGEFAGMYRAARGPLIIAGGRVTNTDGTTAPSGNLVMARWLTQEMIEQIGNQLSLKLIVERIEGAVGEARGAQASDIQVENLDSSKMRVSVVIRGLEGVPALRISSEIPRAIRARAMVTIKTVSLIYMLGGIIAAVIFFMTLDSIVLRRLLRLNREINRISFAGRNSSPVTTEGSDEIARTASTINEMIARLDTAHGLVKKNEAQFRMVTELAPVGIFMTDVDGHCTFVNQHYTDITGRTAAAALGDGWMDAIYPEDRERFVTGRKASLESLEPYTLEVRFLRPDGTVRWARSSAKSVFDDDGNLIGRLGTLTDITSTKLKQIELEHKALYDPLTALANRVLFHDRLTHAFEAARRRPPHHFAVFYMDLDGFKAVNDTHGHEAGDMVLREIAVRISRLLRPGDTLSRVGGDEFAIILRDAVEVRHCHGVANRVLEAVSKPISVGDAEVTVGISIGAAIDYKGYESPNDLVNAADKAMYRAKLGGKNRVIFSNPLTTAAAPSNAG